MSKFKEYLKALGVDAKTITAIEKAEEKNEDIDFKPMVDEFNTGQRKLLRNDDDFIEEIQGAERGKILDQVERKLKGKFGLKPDQIKDIGTGGKPFERMEKIIDLAHGETIKGMDKSLQEVQAELTAANTRLKDLEETEIPKIKSEVEAEKKNFKIANKLSKLIPVDDLRVPLETVDLVLNPQLSAAYDLDLDDDGNVVVFTKGKRIQPKSADGTKLLTAQEIISDILKKNKFVKESNADDEKKDPPKKKVDVTDPEAVRKAAVAATLPHLSAADKHLEDMRKQKEAKAAAAK